MTARLIDLVERRRQGAAQSAAQASQRWRHALADRPLFQDLRVLLELPRVRIDLMHAATAGNDPFFARVVREFYDETQRRHPKLLLVRQQRHGVALCRLPPTFDEYFAVIESSARRNHRKAVRNGYRCERIDFNRHLADVGDIRRSTDVRQGKLPEELLTGEVVRCNDPPTRTQVHDYAWFGVLRNGKLVAYAGCLMAGQLCSIEHLLGHAAYQQDGVVPMLIIGIGEFLYRDRPEVRYYKYGTFFGASGGMRRFQRKMCFLPHRVDWALGAAADERARVAPASDAPPVEVVLDVPDNIEFQVVYRQRRSAPLPLRPVPGATFHHVADPLALVVLRRAARRHFRFRELLKTVLKLATARREYFCVVLGDEIVCDGWVTFGWCRYYHVEPEDAVIGPMETRPELRGRGLATFALASVVNSLYEYGRTVTYVDTGKGNLAMQKVIARCGYGRPVSLYLRGYESPSASAVSGR